MIGEFERPGRRRAAQDRALRRYLHTQVAPYSTRYREVLARTPVQSVSDLPALPLSRLDDDVDPDALVLRPTAEAIGASGDRAAQARLWAARATRRVSAYNRNEIEPLYKPIHWHLARAGATALPIGYTAQDLRRLGELGRTVLEMAGVGPADVLIGIQEPAPDPSFWQLVLGARDAGVSSLFLADDVVPDRIAQLRPNVLTGEPHRLLRLLEDGRAEGYSFAALHTVIAVGQPLEPVVRARLAELAGAAAQPATVVAAWAPAGLRSLWAECKNGTDVHTFPAAEVVELVDPVTGDAAPPGSDGEIVYTPLGWKGTVLLRMRTGVFGCLDDTPCVSCGRTSPRIRLVPFLPPFARVLDGHPDVELWQAELRTVDGAEELIVFLTPRRAGHPGTVLRELDRQLSVTQYVVLDRRQLDARLSAHGDARVVDLRG